jgi:hypothetical protein
MGEPGRDVQKDEPFGVRDRLPFNPIIWCPPDGAGERGANAAVE